MVFAAMASPDGLPFEIVSENYRNRDGSAVRDAVTVVATDADDARFPVRIAGTIGCTNSRGTGRTCKTTATIAARAFPKACTALF